MAEDAEQRKRLDTIKTIFPDYTEEQLIAIDKDLVQSTGDIFQIISATTSTVCEYNRFQLLQLLYIHNNIVGLIEQAKGKSDAVLSK